MTSASYGHQLGSDRVEQLVRRHPGVVRFAQIGWVAKGVVYVLVGVLAVPIALQGLGDGSASGEGEASQTGAVGEIAERQIGSLVLWVVAIGLALYAVWRAVSVTLPAENTVKAWVTRIGYGVSAIVYALLAWSAASFVTSSTGGESEDARVERFSRDVMERAGGRTLVGVIGAVVIAVGIAFVHRGVTAGFRRELSPRAVGPVPYRWIDMAGRVGWVGRGVMMGLVGLFLIRAAMRFRPDQAQGIDGSLREAAASGLGAAAVAFVAAAVIVYGAFCVLSAPLTRLRAAG